VATHQLKKKKKRKLCFCYVLVFFLQYLKFFQKYFEIKTCWQFYRYFRQHGELSKCLRWFEMQYNAKKNTLRKLEVVTRQKIKCIFIFEILFPINNEKNN